MVSYSLKFQARLTQIRLPRHPPIPILFSLILLYFHSFHFPERKKERIYKREYIRGGYRGVARAGLKDG